MNLNSIRYFIEVAKTKSFTKASKSLYVSQPGLSQQIQSLEQQLGVSLLHRTTRKVTLTEEGEYLYNKATSSITTIENTVSNLIESNANPTFIYIATVPSAASIYIPKVLKIIHDQYPEAEFKIKETTSTEVVKLVKDRICHLGFIRTNPNSKNIENNDYNSLVLNPSEIKVAISKHHRLVNRSSIKLQELKEDYFLHYTNSSALYNIVEDLCNQAGFQPKTMCAGSELLTISNIISNNLAITLMPEDMLKIISSENIISLEIEDIKIESSITAIWVKDDLINLNTKLAIDALKKS